MLLVGGGWLVVLPAVFLLLESGRLTVQLRAPIAALPGVALFVAGALLGVVAGARLIAAGRGTPFPLDAPTELVTTGPYAHVRNPQGIAMALMAAGAVLLLRSMVIWAMLPLTLAYLELLVDPWEERQLTNRFGERYLAYKQRVRKWLPRRRRPQR